MLFWWVYLNLIVFCLSKFLVMHLLHYNVFVFQCSLVCFHLFLKTSLVSVFCRVHFHRRKLSFRFITSLFAACILLKCEFWGLLGNFLESSSQPNRKSLLGASLRFLFLRFSVMISQQQASELAFTGPLEQCVLWATLPGFCFVNAIFLFL